VPEGAWVCPRRFKGRWSRFEVYLKYALSEYKAFEVSQRFSISIHKLDMKKEC
jgi:hypothetical protein